MKILTKVSVIGLAVIILCLTIFGRGCPRRARETRVSSSMPPWLGVQAVTLTATLVSYTRIDLSWTSSYNADGYELERSTNGLTYSLLSTFNVNTTSYSDNDLTPFTIYFYRVRATNTIGDRSPWSNVVAVTTVQSLWTDVTAGGDQTFAILSNGTLWAWGRNDSGQLGLGDTINRNTPSLIASDFDYGIFENISAIRCGVNHAIARKTDGTLWSWGLNGTGQLGTGDLLSAEAPFPVTTTVIGGITPDSDWSDFAPGTGFSLAIKTNCTIWSWGQNDKGQLGLGYTTPSTTGITTPTQIGTNSDWSTVAAGGYHILAIKTDGTIWSWGGNGSGQLGLGDNGDRITPTQVGNTSDWSVVATGWNHTIARKTNGTIWSWGNNSDKQLGLGYVGDKNTPTQIGIDSDWTTVGTGANHSIAIKSNGTLWAWGANLYRQLGDGTTTNRYTPRSIGIDSDWIEVGGGDSHTVARKSNGSIWSWGTNWNGQLGHGDTINRSIPHQLGTPILPFPLLATYISSSQINLAWTDNSSNEMCFKIERRTFGTGYTLLATVGPGVTSYSDTGLVPATYYYRIRAYNSWGDSPCSNEAYILINKPSSLIVTYVSSSQINLSWTDNSNNETGFKIERKAGIDGTYTQITATNVNSYTDTELLPAIYYYRVKAYNALGESPYSNEAYIIINAPSSLTATFVSLSQIVISWTNNATNQVGFIVERKTEVNGTYAQVAMPTAEAISLTDSGPFSSATTYYYRVKAYNNFGESPYSNEAGVTDYPPTTPTILSITAITGTISLTWTNVANEIGYKIERSVITNTSYSLLTTVSQDVTSYADTGLAPNTKYYYRVRAYNPAGNSGYSPEKNATTPQIPPNAPTNLEVDVVGSWVSLQWIDNADNEDGFKIERKTGAGGSWGQIGTVGPQSGSGLYVAYPDSTVTAGTTYYYRVRAWNSAGNNVSIEYGPVIVP